jgi:hypothetical protein
LTIAKSSTASYFFTVTGNSIFTWREIKTMQYRGTSCFIVKKYSIDRFPSGKLLFTAAILHQSRAIRKGVSRLRRTGFDSPLVFYSFPDLEEDIRLYSCLAHGSADEFNRGEILFKNKVRHTLSTSCFFTQSFPQCWGSAHILSLPDPAPDPDTFLFS